MILRLAAAAIENGLPAPPDQRHALGDPVTVEVATGECRIRE
jgi:hypothetical protein